MIQQYFGLKHLPFSKSSPALWPNPNLDRLKERFISLLHSPGIGLLTGEPGVGKTAALKHITKNINPHQYQIYYIAETQFTSFDIYQQLAIQLGLVPAHRFAQIWRDIKNHIREQVEHKQTLPIIIFDKAQNLPTDFFRGFPSFLNFDFDTKDMMTVWFVGHPILSSIIDRIIHTTLSSRIHVRYQLHPVVEREPFKQLIDFGFTEAGCQNNFLTESGVELVRIASQGRCRIFFSVLSISLI